MGEITTRLFPSLTQENIDSLKENGIWTLRDFVVSHQSRIMASGRLTEEQYEKARRDAVGGYLIATPGSANYQVSPAWPLPLSTGIPSLDLMLGGQGLVGGEIIEFFGPTATGKTQMCLHIISRLALVPTTNTAPSITTTQPSLTSTDIDERKQQHIPRFQKIDRGDRYAYNSRTGNTGCYIDTTDDFFAFRVFEIAGEKDKSGLGRIIVLKEAKLVMILEQLDILENDLLNRIPYFPLHFRLLILDSLPPTIHPLLNQSNEDGTVEIERLISQLKRMAARFQLSIFLVNGMDQLYEPARTASIAAGESEFLPALGQIWEDVPNIWIRCEQCPIVYSSVERYPEINYRAILVKSSRHSPTTSSFYFNILETGIVENFPSNSTCESKV